MESRKLGTVQKQKKVQAGHTYTKTIKCVCKQCNETWMSGIEETAKPLLIPMLRGLPLSISDEDRLALARWFALKILVIDCEPPSDAVVQQPTRTEFMASGIIPADMTIWLASHNEEDWYMAYFRRAATGSLTGRPPVLADVKNIQMTTWGIGHILVVALVTTIHDFKLNLRVDPPGAIVRFWPLTAERIVWPTPDISLKTANRLANSLKDIFAEWR